MIFLIHHIRKLILTFSLLLGLGIFLFVSQTIKSPSLLQIRLAEYYALTATIFLYSALLATPLYSVFPNLPYKPIYIRSRRALGVSAFFFALTHATIAFFGLLGGFAGLQFLDSRYLFALGFSFTALLILSLMAATSFDFMVKKLGTRWKSLHRFVYLAILLITIHALILGTHFAVLTNLIPKLYFAALSILSILESIRFDRFLAKKFKLNFTFGITLVAVVALLTFGSTYLLPVSGGNSNGLGVHSAHIQLAKDAQQDQATQLPNLPGFTGDRTKRYTASFLAAETVEPGQDTLLKFKIYDASSGTPVSFFLKNYAWPMHLIIVDSSLSYFEHIHPTQQGTNEFTITTQFPDPGVYHLYIQFQPVGAIEQQIGFTLQVGSSEKITPPSQQVDKKLTKVFGDFEVTLDTHGTLNAQNMTLGKDKLSFTIKDAHTKKPITTLKPFMASFGHLTLVNEKTYDFVHVHPYSLTTPDTNANGGPTIDFLPIGIYGSIKSGIYRAFGEFSNKIDTDFDVNFTIEIK